MKMYIDEAFEKGVKMIVFLESTFLIFSTLAKEKDMYIIFGMPERDKENKNVIYNSAVVCAPDDRIISYQKIHLK